MRGSDEQGRGGAVNRRGFLSGVAAMPAGGCCETQAVTLRINQPKHTLDPRTTLLDALRDHAAVTGAKRRCGPGQCGACTAHLEDERVLACLTFAVMTDGREITTVAGPAGELHPMQQTFIDQDAFQCGDCIPE